MARDPWRPGGRHLLRHRGDCPGGSLPGRGAMPCLSTMRRPLSTRRRGTSPPWARIATPRSSTAMRQDPCQPILYPVDLAYLDPPWRSGLAAAALANLSSQGWLGSGAMAVVEQPKAASFHLPDGFTQIDERTLGRARLVFLAFSGGPNRRSMSASLSSTNVGRP